MANGFRFNGLHTSQVPGLERVTVYDKDMIPDMENDLISIPGKDGVIDNGYTFKERVIPVSFSLKGSSIQDYFLTAENVAKWLNTKTVKPLILDALPNRTFLARINSKIDPARIAGRSEVGVNFLVPDVFSSGQQVTQSITRNTVYQYNGNAETFPSFTITVKEALDHLKLTNVTENQFILINRAFSINDIITIDMQKRKIMLNGSVDLRPVLDHTSDYFKIDSDYKLTMNGSASTIQMVYMERWL